MELHAADQSLMQIATQPGIGKASAHYVNKAAKQALQAPTSTSLREPPSPQKACSAPQTTR
jgi:hypothetical protein